MRPYLRVSAIVALVLGIAGPAQANEYGTATETSANYGAQVTRTEKAVYCVGTGAGFVFNDLWQGVQSDAGWIEVGTSYCDNGDANAKWVWARYTPALGYYESVIQRNIPVDTTHSFKIWNYTSDDWRVYIDTAVKVTLLNYGVGGTANSADVGLEVTDNRMTSLQNATYESALYAWAIQASAQSWSGQDSCSDTDGKIYPQWISATSWRHTLNVSASQSTC